MDTTIWAAFIGVGGTIIGAVIPWLLGRQAAARNETYDKVTGSFGQPRPNRRGEARGLHVYEASDESLLVQTYVWRADDWGLTATRRFPRGREPLKTAPA